MSNEQGLDAADDAGDDRRTDGCGEFPVSILGEIDFGFTIVVIAVIAFCAWLMNAMSKPGQGPP